MLTIASRVFSLCIVAGHHRYVISARELSAPPREDYNPQYSAKLDSLMLILHGDSLSKESVILSLVSEPFTHISVSDIDRAVWLMLIEL